MQFLRTLFWVLLAGVAVAFAFNNWTTVPVRLWGGLIADVNLPLLLLGAILLGFLPMLVAYQAMRWRWRQRLASVERTVADLTKQPPSPPIAATPVSDPLPPASPISSDVPTGMA